MPVAVQREDHRIVARIRGNRLGIVPGMDGCYHIGYNDLATTNPGLAKEWHPTKNGELTPQMIPAGTEKKVWWLCEKGHEWQAVVYSRNKGKECPICAREKNKRIVRKEVRPQNEDLRKK